jgi:predicted transcriptional regulator
MRNNINSQRFILLFVAVFFLVSNVSAAHLKVGQTLPPLSIDSAPVSFEYKPTGKPQIILIYPLKYSSRKIGQFNRRVIASGFCPKVIVDMKDRAWYAPLKLAERHIKKEIENSPDPSCTVTTDYEQKAKAVWGLNKGAVVIVVDGDGVLQHLSYGNPTEEQEELVIKLLSSDRAKPRT